MKNEGTSVDICPFLQPNPLTTDGRYIQPANVDKDLSLTTILVILWYDMQYTYSLCHSV